MPKSLTDSMSIDILGAKPDGDILSACPKLKSIKCFKEYVDGPESGIPVRALVSYVVLLYSKDSILNRKPMDNLADRRVRAAEMVELDPENDQVINQVFDLSSEKVRDLILGFLIHQNQMIWTERCIVEAQIQENHRIRFKPIQNKVLAPKEVKKKKGKETESFELPAQVEDDDKYIIEASNKKSTLTDHFSKYYELLKRYDDEIFSDHENVRAASVKKIRVSLESLAK